MTIRPILIAALALSATPAFADDATTCGTVRLSDPGWTDITATNGLASVMLDALGYTPDVQTLSVPIGYEALKGGQIDAFLGNWMPAQKSFRDDLDASGRTTERRAAATLRSASSPAAWPKRSLTSLKRSTSSAISASERSSRPAASSSAVRCSWNAVWLSRPVRASVRALSFSA